MAVPRRREEVEFEGVRVHFIFGFLCRQYFLIAKMHVQNDICEHSTRPAALCALVSVWGTCNTFELLRAG
jgi:hypothetical protein